MGKKLLPILAMSGFLLLGSYSAGTSSVTAATKTLLAGRKLSAGGKYYSDYTSHEDSIKHGLEVNKEIAEEGITLLKNTGILPFDGVQKISVFGKNSVNPYYHGYGAGSQQSTLDVVSLYAGLELAGYETNSSLKDFYNDDGRSGSGRAVDFATGETDIEVLKAEDAVVSTLNAYHDAAIVVISRASQEGNFDPYRNFAYDQDASKAEKDQHYYALTQNEKDLIKFVEDQGFGKIVVLINSASAMEVGELKDDNKIGGLIWVASPGTMGFEALGEILKGEVNPSGHLVDTWYRDFTADPTYQNFGDGSQNSDNGKTAMYDLIGSTDEEKARLAQVDAANKRFTSYEEGIYVGYRYYETKYADLAASDGQIAADKWYEDTMAYPFGYGLSYTDFEITDVVSSVSAGTDLLDVDEITVKVTVKNVGDVAGKHVVQLYSHAPYTAGEVEKSDIVLAGFAKTALIQPGKSDTVEISIHIQDLASYDYNDANNNSHTGYELDAGDYELRIQSNAHDVDKVIDYVLSADRTFDTDRITGQEVENRFVAGKEMDYSLLPDENGVTMKLMSREDFGGTFPKAPTESDRTINANSATYKAATTEWTKFFDGDLDSTSEWYRAVDSNARQEAEDTVNSSRKLTYQFSDLAGLELDDAKWDTVLNELKYSEMVAYIAKGMRGITAIPALGIPAAYNFDGPTTLNQVDYGCEPLMAATWNVDLIEELGNALGDEALWVGLHGWYAPGMNIHRSPFGGRNYEYYSEDGFLSGKMAATEIAAAQEKGLYVFAKHFALNEQETNRTGIATYLTEQAAREIYLKPFQMAIEEGGSMGVMTAFNKVGDVHTYANNALVNDILKGEWDFQGFVVTDTGPTGQIPSTPDENGVVASPKVANYWTQVLCGNDLTLGNTSNLTYYGEYDANENAVLYNGKKVGSLWMAVREACKRVIKVNANSSLQGNMLDLSAFSGSEEFNIGANVTMNKDIGVPSTANVGTNNIVYKVTEGKLPEGFTLSNSGLLSGVTTEHGTYKFTITMFADGWKNASKEFTAIVGEPAYLANSNGDRVTELAVGEAFNGQFATDVILKGDTRVAKDNMKEWRTYVVLAVDYDIVSGTLPAGMSLGEKTEWNTGKNAPNRTTIINEPTSGWNFINDQYNVASDAVLPLEGTPTKAGTYTFVLALSVYEKYLAGSDSTRYSYNTASYTAEITLTVTGESAEEDKTAALIADLEDQVDTLNNEVETLNSALESAQESIDELTAKIDAMSGQSGSSTNSNGCGGSIIASSAIMSVLALTGCVLVISRRRKDK